MPESSQAMENWRGSETAEARERRDRDRRDVSIQKLRRHDYPGDVKQMISPIQTAYR